MDQETRPTDANNNPIYRIPEGNLSGLEARIAKLNKRAAKIGVDPLLLTIIGEAFETKRKQVDGADDTGRPRYIEYQVRYVLVVVTGTCPRINGWTFAATINHDEAGNILRTAPGIEFLLPLKYRTVTTECEHCSKDRRRNDTYVLFSDAGEWKQVGRNCLADFLRTENPAGLAQWAEVVAGVDEMVSEYEEMGEGCRSQVYYRAVDVLAQVACCVRQDGWYSRTEAKNSIEMKQASADQALMWFDDKWVSKQSAADKGRYAVSMMDTEAAEQAIAWAQSIEADVTNDYLWNVRTISYRESITYRDAGLAGSIIVAHKKHLEREQAKKYEREHTLNEYFGEVGKREVFVLTVLAARDMQSDYGAMTLYKFRDADGRPAAWFSSGSKNTLEIGTTYTVKATVKKHELYNGQKQTTLSRLETYDAAAEAKQKEAVKQAKKRIKKDFTCTHLEGLETWKQYRYDVPCGVTYIDVKCCLECQQAWTTRDRKEVA